MAMVEVLLLLAVAAFLAGLAGSYLGIGGGIFLIPFMTLALGIDIKVAIATSLSSVYFDQEDQGVYRYRVERPGAGFGASAAAGVFSGLLGVGGGFIKVPAMNILMRVPMKAAVATSNFMIGVTAAASAFIYYSQGLVNPQLAAMVIVGAFTGTNLGTRLLVRSKAANVRFLFAFSVPNSLASPTRAI